MFKEFKEFAMRGNVMDLAVGVVIGGAFGKIINSLVGDIIMPPFGLILGKVDFSRRYLEISGVQIRYGMFVNNLIQFLIVAFALFVVIKQVNRFRRQEPLKPTDKDCPFCQTRIPLLATRCPNCTSKL